MTNGTLTANTDEAIAAAMAQIESQYGKVGTFIHLHPHFEFENGHFTQHFNDEQEK